MPLEWTPLHAPTAVENNRSAASIPNHFFVPRRTYKVLKVSQESKDYCAEGRGFKSWYDGKGVPPDVYPPAIQVSRHRHTEVNI